MTKSIFRLSAFPRQVRFSCCHSALSLSLSFCAVTFAVILRCRFCCHSERSEESTNQKQAEVPLSPLWATSAREPPPQNRGLSNTIAPADPCRAYCPLLVCKISTTRPLHRPAALCIGPFVWVNKHFPSCTCGTLDGTQVVAEGKGMPSQAGHDREKGTPHGG